MCILGSGFRSRGNGMWYELCGYVYNVELRNVEYRCGIRKIPGILLQNKIITYTLRLTLTITLNLTTDLSLNLNAIPIPHLCNAECIKLQEFEQYCCKIKS